MVDAITTHEDSSALGPSFQIARGGRPFLPPLVPEPAASGYPALEATTDVIRQDISAATLDTEESSQMVSKSLYEQRRRRVEAWDRAWWDDAEIIPVACAEPHDRPIESIQARQAATIARFINNVELDIAEDVEAARSEGEPDPTTDAIATCRWIAGLIAPLMSDAPRLKSAAFTQENGGISFVIQSLSTRRRVEFRIPPEENNISTIKVDENLGLERRVVGKNQPDALLELAKWVIRLR